MGRPTSNIFTNLCCFALFLILPFPVVESTVDKYHADIRVFVDPSAVDKWRSYSGKTTHEEFKKEVTSVFVEVQERYKSLREYNQVEITLGIEQFVFFEKNLVVMKPHPNPKKHQYPALSSFRTVIKPSYYKKHYDIAILLTGHQLDHRVGVAYVNTPCKYSAAGMINMNPHNTLVTVIAHETGHILGASHDSDSHANSPCYLKNGNIMNPAVRNTALRFKFSPCSSNYFKERLGKLKKNNCLTDGHGPITGQRLGDLVTPDEVCRRYNLVGGFVLRSHYNQKSYSTICNRVYCTDAHNKVKKSGYSLQGLKCGKNKVCNRAKCEKSYEGSPFILDSCPLGDQPKVGSKLDQTCAEIDPADCPKYQNTCCFSCDKNNPVFKMTADDVCRIVDGDKSVMLRTNTSHGDQLCSQLKCSTSHLGKMNTYEAPDGMACGKSKRCTKGKCLFTKHGNPNIPDYCPFGDQDLKSIGYKGTCKQHSVSECHIWKDSCCDSCRGKY